MPPVQYLLLLALVSASPAFAQSAGVSAPDTDALVSFVNSMWAPISAVIGAFTAIVIGVKGWKLVRRA